MTTKRSFVSRSLKVVKWAAMGVGVLVVAALAGGAIYEQFAKREAFERFPPRGQMVDIGGRRIHLDCRGAGTPTVILESGLDINGSLSWYKIQDEIAKITRTCSYDRAGIMWSDAPPHKQDGDHVAQDLHATLAAAGIDGPLVLIGHSLGGPYMMNYTRQFGSDVKGLVFVDASHPDQIRRLAAPGTKPKPPELPAFMYVLAKLSWTGAARLIDLPGDPDEPKAVTAARNAYLGHSIKGAVAEISALETILNQGGRLRDLGNRPIVVLTAMKPYSLAALAEERLTPKQGAAQQKRWLELHDEEAGWSRRSRHESLSDSGHYVQNDRPDAVIRAADEIVAAVRGAPGGK